jgi:tryptophan 7-halogenase
MNIIIVGGGTAGWSSALGLSSLHGLSDSYKINIKVICNENIPSIGVGESLLPYINNFHELNEFNTSELSNDWLNKCDCTQKKGNLLVNFSEDRIGFNPFELKTDRLDKVLDEYYYLPYIPGYAEKEVSVLSVNTPIPDEVQEGSLGLHIDSIKYQQVLKDICINRKNVQHIDSNVQNVKMSADGSVNSIVLANGIEEKADLFIDCTGFSRVLRSKMPESTFTDFSDTLLTNRALVYTVPYQNETAQIKQCGNITKTVSAKYGWIWEIPLKSCVKIGYVFSDNHASMDEIKKEADEYISAWGFNGNINDLTTLDTKFNAGMVNELWHKNVIAIGLSSFFIEPLQSTGIYFFQKSIDNVINILIKHMKADDKLSSAAFNSSIDELNRNTSEILNSVKDIIELHYRLSDRADSSFWIDCVQPLSTTQQKIISSFLDKTGPQQLICTLNKKNRTALFSVPVTIMFLKYFTRTN